MKKNNKYLFKSTLNVLFKIKILKLKYIIYVLIYNSINLIYFLIICIKINVNIFYHYFLFMNYIFWIMINFDYVFVSFF